MLSKGREGWRALHGLPGEECVPFETSLHVALHVSGNRSRLADSEPGGGEERQGEAAVCLCTCGPRWPVCSRPWLTFGLDPLCAGCPPDPGWRQGKGAGSPEVASQHVQTLRVLCLGGKPHRRPD